MASQQAKQGRISGKPARSGHLMLKPKWIVLSFGLLVAVLYPSVFVAESTRIQIIDRGQADGILIRTPNKKWVVIDAGTSKQQAEAMKDTWGVKELELAIVSHRHRDHQGGMDDVLRMISTKLFIGITEDCPTVKSDDRVRDEIDKKSIPTYAPQSEASKAYVIDGVTFTVLPLPALRKCPDEENMNSILIRLDYGDFSMLFTGDAEDEVLDWYVEHHSELLDVDILKASHHGSNNGYTDEFLKAVSPQRVVISAGVNATYGHPHKAAVAAYEQITGGKVYCTNRHMTIRVYGYADGRSRLYKQNKIDKSCAYDRSHY